MMSMLLLDALPHSSEPLVHMGLRTELYKRISDKRIIRKDKIYKPVTGLYVFPPDDDDVVMETRQLLTIFDQLAETSQKIRSLETVLEENPKQLAKTAEISQRVGALETVLEANTKQLEETKNQVARMTALLEVFVKGKAKDVAVEVAFPVASLKDLVVIELEISPESKERYMEAITQILKRNHL
ncbi:uncharacterized protein LOC122625155 [Drosophila teissieri]|uniref:uncharacterized protein LOC122625155 n=1 Tax=Drosophila teissieri TaxID=7243 RepID=UPI001CBA22C6|nr:uncharacterized protein LOC122625155 [Drosophila teissieri]